MFKKGLRLLVSDVQDGYVSMLVCDFNSIFFITVQGILELYYPFPVNSVFINNSIYLLWLSRFKIQDCLFNTETTTKITVK